MFGGAGYAGVEGLAELQDFATRAIDLYPGCRAQGMRWEPVEARERIMGEVPKDSQGSPWRELKGRGIEIDVNTTLERVERSATLSNGERVAARTLVWTAGVSPSPVVGWLGLPLQQGGRILADSECGSQRHHGVWAIGDCAAVPDPATADGRARRRPSTRSVKAGWSAAQRCGSLGQRTEEPLPLSQRPGSR